MAKFPSHIKVVVDTCDDSNPQGLLAYRLQDDAVDEAGITEVATYKLIEVQQFRKETVPVGKPKFRQL